MNLRRLRAVARKETIHILRDPRSLLMAIGIPLLMIVIFGYALTLDVDQVPVAVWDQSNTPASRELISRFSASRYFNIHDVVNDYSGIAETIDRRSVFMALVIDANFADDVRSARTARVQVIVDGADANTAAIVMGYAQGVAASFNHQLLVERTNRIGRPGAGTPALDFEPRVLFNADLESKNFIIPGLIAVIMGLIAALLTSLTVAREWERGTMEQLVSTPVKPAELILGKLLPYVVVGMLDVAIAVGMAVFVFKVPLRGSVPLLFAMALLFIIGTLAQGIFISTIARGQLLASQLAMVSTFLPAFLLSGFMFAISNMPPVVQAITYIVPARYFVALVKGIYLRGVGLQLLWRDAVFLVVFAIVVTALAIVRFRKRVA